MRKISKAVVIGAGVMGAGIAAHLANVGIKTVLLDIVPNLTEGEPVSRNRLAAAAKDRLLKATPSPLYSKESIDLITVGNIEDDLQLVSQADWVIEAIVENLALKQELLKKLDAFLLPGTIISSNTSGVSIEAMVQDCSPELKRHFLGTHFFNPPRYMKLIELIPHPNIDPKIVLQMKEFSERVLGKRVVMAKDTPNFIANRVGTYGLMVTLQEMSNQQFTIEEVDQLTGPLLGRPKSATFRTLDIVGLDTFVSVANNVYDLVSDQSEKRMFKIPLFLKKMVDKRVLGVKTGGGFYKKVKSERGSEILTLDLVTMNYRPIEKVAFAVLDTVKSVKSLKEKLNIIIYANDPAGRFVWTITKRVLLYSANKVLEIADDIAAIDQAMRWGFNWELGPFELWDAIGVQRSVDRMREEGEEIPLWVENMLKGGTTSFYSQEQHQKLYFSIKGETAVADQPDSFINLAALKEQNKVVLQNSGASLIDIGDDVACLEFHSQNNAIGTDIITMIHRSLKEVERNYRGLVIGNMGKNFCVGANLMILLMEAQDENWLEIEQIVRSFQKMTLALKYFEKPIVTAPFGMTLGGGTEVCLPTFIQAAAETYMGLVEVGVGLIPGGGGNKELLLRNLQGVDFDGKVDLQPFVNKTFETIALAKVSTSAKEARELAFLTHVDRITVNKDYLLYDAKQSVLALSAVGYEPRIPRKIRVVGSAGQAVLKLGIYQMKCSGYISDHDERIANKLANVLSGGNVVANSYVTEQYLLDLEREAFLSLCGEPKTQQRMEHMLLKGKPLRN